MPTIPYREGAEFVKLPTSTPILCKITQANFTTEDNPFFGKKDAKGKVDERKTREVVKVILDALETEYLGGRIWKTFGASIHEQSALRPFINAASDRDLTTEELKRFNTDDLIGRFVSIIGTYAETDLEQKFLKPTAFFRANPKAVKVAMDTLIASNEKIAAGAPAPRSSGSVREVVAAAAGEIDF